MVIVVYHTTGRVWTRVGLDSPLALELWRQPEVLDQIRFAESDDIADGIACERDDLHTVGSVAVRAAPVQPEGDLPIGARGQ